MSHSPQGPRGPIQRSDIDRLRRDRHERPGCSSWSRLIRLGDEPSSCSETRAPAVALPDETRNPSTACPSGAVGGPSCTSIPRTTRPDAPWRRASFSRPERDDPERGADVWGISPQGAASKRKFREKVRPAVHGCSPTRVTRSPRHTAHRVEKQNYGRTYWGTARTTFLVDPGWPHRQGLAQGHAGGSSRDVLGRARTSSAPPSREGPASGGFARGGDERKPRPEGYCPDRACAIRITTRDPARVSTVKAPEGTVDHDWRPARFMVIVAPGRRRLRAGGNGGKMDRRRISEAWLVCLHQRRSGRGGPRADPLDLAGCAKRSSVRAVDIVGYAGADLSPPARWRASPTIWRSGAARSGARNVGGVLTRQKTPVYRDARPAARPILGRPAWTAVVTVIHGGSRRPMIGMCPAAGLTASQIAWQRYLCVTGKRPDLPNESAPERQIVGERAIGLVEERSPRRSRRCRPPYAAPLRAAPPDRSGPRRGPPRPDRAGAAHEATFGSGRRSILPPLPPARSLVVRWATMTIETRRTPVMSRPSPRVPSRSKRAPGRGRNPYCTGLDPGSTLSGEASLVSPTSESLLMPAPHATARRARRARPGRRAAWPSGLTLGRPWRCGIRINQKVVRAVPQ